MIRPVLLMTRPRPDAERFLELLCDEALLKVSVVISPVIEIFPLGADIRIPSGTKVIFTSVNGVEGAPEGQGRIAFCVGSRTTRRAIERGWDAEMVGVQADDLVQTLLARNIVGPILHLTGVHQRGNIVERLRDQGVTADRLAIYDQRPVTLTAEANKALSGPSAVFLPVFSPRSAEQLLSSLAVSRHVIAVAISEAAAEPLREAPLERVIVASEPTGEAMRESLEKIMLRHSLP